MRNQRDVIKVLAPLLSAACNDVTSAPADSNRKMIFKGKIVKALQLAEGSHHLPLVPLEKYQKRERGKKAGLRFSFAFLFLIQTSKQRIKMEAGHESELEAMFRCGPRSASRPN